MLSSNKKEIKKSHINTNDPRKHVEGEKEKKRWLGEAVKFLLAISVALEEIWNLKKIEQDFYICVPYSLIGSESWVKR